MQTSRKLRNSNRNPGTVEKSSIRKPYVAFAQKTCSEAHILRYGNVKNFDYKLSNIYSIEVLLFCIKLFGFIFNCVYVRGVVMQCFLVAHCEVSRS